MKIRIIALSLCLAGVSSIIPTHEEDHITAEAIEEQNSDLNPRYVEAWLELAKTNINCNTWFKEVAEAKGNIEQAQANLTSVQHLLTQDEQDQYQRNIDEVINQYHTMLYNIKLAIQHCNAEAYARKHGVTPEEFIKKLDSNTWSDNDVIAYTKYRIVHRLQRRISLNETWICNDDEQQSEVDHTNGQTTQNISRDVDSITKYVLESGIEVCDLEGESALCEGYNKIKIDRNFLMQLNFPMLYTIEHEITHLEEFNNFYINTQPFGMHNLQEESRKEYAADYEAPRFVPFPYANYIHSEFSNQTYYITKDMHQSGCDIISYPPTDWIHRQLAEQTRRLPDADKAYQRKLYMRYGCDVDSQITHIITGSLVSASLHAMSHNVRSTGAALTVLNNFIQLLNLNVHFLYPNQISWYISRSMKPVHIAATYLHNWLPMRMYNTIRHYITDGVAKAWQNTQSVYKNYITGQTNNG